MKLFVIFKMVRENIPLFMNILIMCHIKHLDLSLTTVRFDRHDYISQVPKQFQNMIIVILLMKFKLQNI